MGASGSKTSTSMEVINKTLTEIVNRNINNCMIKGQMSQIMRNKCNIPTNELVQITNSLANSPVCIELLKGKRENPNDKSWGEMYLASCSKPCLMMGNKQDMVATFNMDCLMDTKVSNGIINDIKNDLKQKADKENKGLASLLAKTDTNTRIKLQNDIENAFTNENISNSLIEMKMLQIIDNTNSTSINNEQKMGASLIVKSMMSNSAINNALTDLASKADQESSEKNTGPIAAVADNINSMVNNAVDKFGNIGALMVMIAPIIMIIAVIFVLKGGLGKVVSARRQLISGSNENRKHIIKIKKLN